VVLGDVLIAGLDQVAVQAGDVGVGVAALGPVGKYAGVVARWHSMQAWASGGTLRSMRYSLTLAKLGWARARAPAHTADASKPMVKQQRFASWFLLLSVMDHKQNQKRL
jgi:hypothetical protein